jgi:hypothetical protein
MVADHLANTHWLGINRYSPQICRTMHSQREYVEQPLARADEGTSNLASYCCGCLPPVMAQKSQTGMSAIMESLGR